MKDVYLLSYAFHKRKLYYAGSDTKGFNEYRFYDGNWIEDWPHDIVFYFSGKPGEDFIPGGLHYILISERVRQVFIREKIPGVQFLPANAILKETGINLGLYYVLNVVRTVKELNSVSIDNIDIFRRINDIGIFISARLVQILEKEGAASGAGFIRMPI